MSENGVMDRPRRSTRNSLASSSAGTPSTPASSNNPYKKPTYLSNSRGGGGETPTSSKNTNGTPSSSGRGRRGRGRPPGRNSSGRSGGSQNSYQHSKPECIAVRVDGRRSTGGSTASSGGGRRGAATSGGRRSTYSSRHEYDYHYGSDFDSDQNDSELEEDDVESEPEEDSVADSLSLAGDNDDSDSDFSVSSSTRVSSSRLPSPPVPIWLDAEKVPNIPPLELPHSSDDLLLSREHVVKAVEIYEPLRRFYQLVRLSPFRFEDFCAALACEDQSSLLAEMHIQLLKSVIREEDSNGTLFGPNEVKDSIQAVVYFIDHITWPETIRSYLESDPAWKDVYDAIVSVEYPFCGPAIRIKVLGWLVDQFLTTNVVREQLLGDGTILHEDHCRACNRLGELICCESCPAVYHIECLNPPLKDPDNPPDMWKCPVCVKHQTPGVNDCTSEVEKMGLLIRHERLGYDRHGRKYWFLVRRILVESEDGSEVWYYSTRGQVEDLLTRLDASGYESTLVDNIKAIEDEVYRQIEVTEEVTRLQNTQRRKTYLDIENGKDMEGDGPERMTRLKSTGLYKLGQENLFKTYSNLFNMDPLAMSKGKQNEERDRKRHMSHKFSLTTASECKYGIKDLNGCTRQIQISAMRGALSHMEAVLPTTLMHVNWPVLRKTWLTGVQTSTCAADFSRAMLMISTCIRNAVYNPVWSESAGLVRFSRMTQLEREERKKAEKRDKKDKDDEEDRLKAEAQFTKNPLPIRHQVYKQKGEEYRVHGRWGWIWLSNMRRCKSQDCREMGLLAGPHKHVIQVKNETGKVKTMLIDPGVYSKLMAKRNLAVSNTAAASAAAAKANAEAPSNADTSPVAASVERTSSSEEKSENETTEPNCTEDSSSSSNSNKENGGDDVEMKDANSSESKDQPKESPSEVIKVEDDEKSKSSTAEEKSDEIVEQVEKSAAVSVENQEKAQVEPKTEPMDVDSGVLTQSTNEETTQEKPMMNGEVSEEENSSSEQPQKEESSQEASESMSNKESDKEPEQQEQKEAEKATEAMDVDPTDPAAAEKAEEKSPSPQEREGSSEEKPSENGTTSGDENGEMKQEAKESTETSSSSESQPTVPAESQASVAAAPPPTPAPAPAPETKTEDTQGRKFKTELVNVSSGLASAHRILYPKVARRSEYLDSLLHRRLTLMSLEEKQLKGNYGEDMVAKAKQGLIQFEEEEKKRAQEADEYPGEEVVDDNLTLGGAYAFCCYSSECRKEARDFMKTKGKNRERTYEKICYSPMCRLKFCLQETTRFKQERLREMEKEKYYKVYKEIEEKRQYTLEGTTHKVYMKKLPDCLTVTPAAAPASGGIGGGVVPSALHNSKKKPKTPPIKYPQLSTFRYASSKRPSILVLPQFELRRLSRTAGRQFNPAGFFPNQKSGSWGWSLPCGRPVFRTAWQYKTMHSGSLATAAMQLRILYASIRWDDILAKIPNNDGRHQVHTDTEIITTEILNHRIVGRFMERVQYLRRMQVVPIDAPKTIREITPSRIGLRKRKRAESPDKTEPVITEDWVDEEKLELWEIRFYGDRIDRKHTGVTGGIIGRFSDSNTPSTRTKSGIAIKQPEKYDPSHNPTHTAERRTYGAHQNALNPQQPLPNANATGAVQPTSSLADTVDSTIEQVIRNHDPKSGEKTVSAVKTAELMRETIETEMKMQRAVHLSKRDSHAKNGNANNNGSKTGISTPVQPTASQQFQMQQNNAKGGAPGSAPAALPSGKNPPSTPTSSKVGGVVVGKKFFSNRQSTTGAVTTADGGILTKRPLQNTITINKGAGGTISVVKNNPTPLPAPTQPPQQLAQVPTTIAVTTLGQSVTNSPGNLPPAVSSMPPQKLSVIRLPDGRLQVKGLLPGQHCYQTPDGKIHVTVSAAHVQAHLQQQQQAAKQTAATTTNAPLPIQNSVPTSAPAAGDPNPPPPPPPPATTMETPPVAPQPQVALPSNVPTIPATSTPAAMPVITSTGTLVSSVNSPVPVTASASPAPQPIIAATPQQHQVMVPQPVVTSSAAGIIQVPQGSVQVAVSSQQTQQPVINISNQAVKSNISSATGLVATTGPNNKPTITIQQPQQPAQIIVQQPNGQQLIIQGPAAQALLQQQQKMLQQRQMIQTSIASQPQLIKQTVVQAGTGSPAAVGAVVTSTSATGQQIQGRLVIQDGKAVLIGGTPTVATATQPQRSVIVNSKPGVQTSVAIPSPQPTVVRPQMIQTSAGGLIQGGTVQLIQSGQGLQLISQQQPQQVVSSAAAPAVITSLATTASATPIGPTTASAAVEMSATSSVATSPAKTSVVSSTPATPVSTAMKNVFTPGKTVLLSPSQLSDLNLNVGPGRKLVVNKQVLQLPTSTATGIRPTTQQQILQSLMGSAGPIQIVQGIGGQQFLIQQPANTTGQPAAAAVIQPTQQQPQQQVQIVMPTGQLGAGQPVVVKKLIKPGGSTPTVSSSTTTAPNSVPTTSADNKTPGNVVQIGATAAQNQLTQLLGPNKTLVRLENNQLAAIQLQQTQTVVGAPQPGSPVASPVPSSPTPATSPQQQQQQTTITRTPGLPISIVSPSKSKTSPQQQQQQQPPKGTTHVVVSTNASSSPLPQASPTSATGKTSTPTVIRVGSPVVKSTSPAPRVATPPATPQKLSSATSSPVKPTPSVTTPVLATKSAPPPIHVTTTPTGPVIISSQPPQQQPQISIVSSSPASAPVIQAPAASSPVITATKSQPPPVPQDATPIAVKSLPPPVTPPSTPVPNKAPTVTPIAVKSSPATSPMTPSTAPSTPVPVVSPATSTLSTPKTKAPPSKIVAQIFQTPQGPKVVIQGVNPGELTQSQMMQLQAQISKQLTAQHQQQLPKPAVVQAAPSSTGKATPAVMPPASSALVQLQSTPQNNSTMTPVHQQTTSTLPSILQSAKQQSGGSLSAQHQSPVEVLRSGPSVSHSSSIIPRSPPPTTMVSPAKVLSPPANLPTLLSPPKSVVGRQDMVAALSSVKEPSVIGSPTSLSSPPVVVARKSQPRKSPIRPNNLDSPPPPPAIMSPPPLPPPVVHNNVNNVAMELMRPLDPDQQELLAEKRSALKEEIMEKKKAAATQMRLEAQREVQEKLERQKAIELVQEEERKRQMTAVQQQSNSVNDSIHSHQAKGAKKRKMDHSSSGGKNSSEGTTSPAAAANTARTPSGGNSAAAGHKGPRSKGGKRGGKRKLLCICKTPYEKNKFYVGCDKCDNWFHGDCIGITEQMSKDIQEYICDDCKDDKLYCMCKKPYNESQFYIQCDKCEDWFHGRCVGVVQGESDAIGDYSCPQCEPNSEINSPNGKKLDAGDYITLSRLLKELMSNRSSQPFRKPVTKAQAPNYHAIIKEPMDLQTISNRVEERQYERLREFIGDVEKIFENCRYYNDSTTDIFRHAENLEKFFVQKIWALRQTLNTRLQQVTP